MHRTWTASTTRVMAPSESFFKPLVVVDQKPSLASLSLALPVQESFLVWGPSLFFGVSGTQRGPLAWGPTL